MKKKRDILNKTVPTCCNHKKQRQQRRTTCVHWLKQSWTKLAMRLSPCNRIIIFNTSGHKLRNNLRLVWFIPGLILYYDNIQSDVLWLSLDMSSTGWGKFGNLSCFAKHNLQWSAVKSNSYTFEHVRGYQT